MTYFIQLSRFIALFVLLPLSITACSGAKTSQEISDPFEGRNRAVHAFNETVDQAAIEPVAEGYRYIVPTPARKGVRNVLRNLRTPTNLANELLQGDLKGAGTVITRASVNTLIGLGGLIDVAGHEGIAYEQEDFGQTLAVWGVDHGPYLVAPLFGPGSIRDYSGLAVDSFSDPLNNWLFNTGHDTWAYTRTGFTVLDVRENLLDVLKDLRNNSIDHYATLKSVYTQNRNNLISDGRASVDSLPDFE